MDKEPIKYKTQVVPVSSIEVHPICEGLNIETSELSKSEAEYFNYMKARGF
jgi:hypothetical protein